MAKTIEDLQRSREQREAVVEKLGAVPESILVYDRSVRALDLMAQERDYASGANDGGHNGKLGKVFDVSGQSCRGESGALSRFPQNIGRLLLLLYTKAGDIVVDPFAGHNSRMEMCWRAGRNYYGNDLSRVFMEANRKVRDILLAEKADDLFGSDHTAEIYLSEGDSRKLPWENGHGHFTITSPPYWNIEYYGDEPEQLGNRSYERFLDALREVMAENFRVLRPGAFCVWCVNDFRKDGKFYDYHGDTARLLRAVGFVQHDIAITDLGPAIRAAFAQQIVETKILPKRHEYNLIFRKPK